RNDNVREGLTSAVIKIAEKDIDVTSFVTRAFVSPSPEVHNHAIEIVGILRYEEAIPKIIQSYMIHQKKVMKEAIQSLKNFGKPAVDELIKVLAIPDSEAQKKVAEIMKELKQELVIPALIDGLEDPQLSDSCVNVLKRIGDKAIIQFIGSVPGGDILTAKKYGEKLENHPKMQKVGTKALENIPR
ncbi:MAG: HEAT repeat domain-containing protein, partial [Candidatus Hodarchaeales archaeon]